MRVFIITTEWPTEKNPHAVPFLTQHVNILRESGIEVEVFHFHGTQNPINYLLSWQRIRKTPFWKKADILHAHWGQSAFLTLFSNKKRVITFHGSDLQGIVDRIGRITIKGRILIALSKWMATLADYCIVVSAKLIPILPNKCRNVRIIPIGIDTQEFHPMDKKTSRETLDLDQNDKIVLFMSDPNRTEKRFAFAQKAIEKFQIQHPELRIRLLVVSGVDYSTIPYYINSGDVLLLTSTHEGSPTVVKEALACKVPIVSFDVGDVAERINGIDGCYLCEERTFDCLIKGLEVALEHGPLIDLPESATRQLDESFNVLEILDVYKTLLGNVV